MKGVYIFSSYADVGIFLSTKRIAEWKVQEYRMGSSRKRVGVLGEPVSQKVTKKL
jgi:hypothetical protein